LLKIISNNKHVNVICHHNVIQTPGLTFNMSVLLHIFIKNCKPLRMDDGFVVTKMTGNIDATSVGQTLININKDIDFGNL